MPLRSVMVHDSLPRTTLAVISPSNVKLAYDERISRPLSLKLETIVSFAMRIPWSVEVHLVGRPESVSYPKSPQSWFDFQRRPELPARGVMTFLRARRPLTRRRFGGR